MKNGGLSGLLPALSDEHRGDRERTEPSESFQHIPAKISPVLRMQLYI